MDVGSLVWRAACRFGPTRVAVEGPDGQRSFAELGDRVTRIARGLRALGLHDGDAVLDLQGNRTTAIETDLAIRSAGLVRVALNYRLHVDDWESIAHDAGARALIVESRFLAATESLRNGMSHVIVVDEDAEQSLDKLLADQPSGRLPTIDMDALCGLHYSSGTTGRPKGAQRTHTNWWSSLGNMTHDVLRVTPGPGHCYVHAGPITHTSGLFVLPFLTAGARQIVLPAWDPETFMDSVQSRGATHTALVPTMVSRLLSNPSRHRDEFSNLQMLAYAGAPMPSEQVRDAFERITPHLVQYYGLVEAIPPVTVLDADDHRRGLAGEPELLTSAGRAALGVEIQVVDDDARPLPDGEIGEVITRGQHVMGGYRNSGERDDLGKAVRDGWLFTGDLGRMDSSGHLWLIDRRGDMIISGGYNIYPREVEEVVSAVPGVDEVAVLGVTDRDWGQRVVALYTLRPGFQIDDDDIMSHCERSMASYKKPKQLRRVDSLPVSANGKIAKKVLREQLEHEA